MVPCPGAGDIQQVPFGVTDLFRVRSEKVVSNTVASGLVRARKTARCRATMVLPAPADPDTRAGSRLRPCEHIQRASTSMPRSVIRCNAAGKLARWSSVVDIGTHDHETAIREAVCQAIAHVPWARVYSASPGMSHSILALDATFRSGSRVTIPSRRTTPHGGNTPSAWSTLVPAVLAH
jgi:hypothetical protein